MASESLYCMECVEGRPVALGLCADCLAGEPLEEVIRQIARLARELEGARELIRDLVDREPICVALRSKYVEVRIDGGTWDDARRFVGLDLIGDDDMTPPAGDAPAHPVDMAQPDEGAVL